MRLIRTPRAYEIQKTCRFDFMVRVINAKKLLEIIKKPADCDFAIKVSDDLISENNGVFHVTADSVIMVKDMKLPDLVVSHRALSQMAVGCINLDEAMLRPDVEVNGNEEMLRRVFIEKKIYVGEFF